MTFRAADIDKFLAYIPHADIVNGTRIVEQLRESRTQLTTFMYYGNFFVGKLLEAKHLGQGTFTDVGHDLQAVPELGAPHAAAGARPGGQPGVQRPFPRRGAAITAIPMVECPITFHRGWREQGRQHRATARAFKVGLRMILGIYVRAGSLRRAQMNPGYHETRFHVRSAQGSVVGDAL